MQATLAHVAKMRMKYLILIYGDIANTLDITCTQILAFIEQRPHLFDNIT